MIKLLKNFEFKPLYVTITYFIFKPTCTCHLTTASGLLLKNMGIFMINVETIRELREQNDWTQEQMAEKLGITRNGYAKIERGESMPNLERLNDIATLFGVEITELLDNKNIFCQISENHSNTINYNSDQSLVSEIEKLKLTLSYKDELLTQKDKEIELLRKLLDKV